MSPPTIFNGRYTIENTKTKEHRTFQIKTQKEGAKFAPGKRLVALLSGPDNEADYTGFAFIDDKGIMVWSKKRGSLAGRSPYEWYANMLWSLATEGEKSSWYVKGYRLLSEATCLRCNRTLTEPESLRTGLGPVCGRRGN